MLALDAVDETGRLLPPDEAPESAIPYIDEADSGVRFILDRESGVYISGSDVRALQLAKAAVAGGIEALLGNSSIKASDVRALFLAGGFGNYLRPESAAAIGMIPSSLATNCIPCGNAAGAGAVMALLCQADREALSDIQRRTDYIELSYSGAFLDAYVERMMFEAW